MRECNSSIDSHTPGPWVTDGPAQYAGQLGCVVYAKPEGDIGHLVAQCPPEYSNNQQANAKLISAAPDMLLALKTLVQWSEYGGDAIGMLEDAVEQAKRAIEKAGAE